MSFARARSFAGAAAAIAVLAASCAGGAAEFADAYVPPPDPEWRQVAPDAVGMDSTRLAAAIAFAGVMETDFPRDFSTTFRRNAGPSGARSARCQVRARAPMAS
jgi:hypothetical protein